MPEEAKRSMKKLLCKIGWHFWGKWIDVEKEMLPHNHNHQVRECLECGLKQKRWFN